MWNSSKNRRYPVQTSPIWRTVPKKGGRLPGRGSGSGNREKIPRADARQNEGFTITAQALGAYRTSLLKEYR